MTGGGAQPSNGPKWTTKGDPEALALMKQAYPDALRLTQAEGLTEGRKVFHPSDHRAGFLLEIGDERATIGYGPKDPGSDSIEVPLNEVVLAHVIANVAIDLKRQQDQPSLGLDDLSFDPNLN